MHSKLFFLSALAAPFVSAHSWVEQLSVIDANGKFVGSPGYMRGYKPRGEGFNDELMVARFPPSNDKGITRLTDPNLEESAKKACKPEQAKPDSNSPEFPVLVAQPGNIVALKYLENGHVTLPQNQPGKPEHGGLVYVYATMNPNPDALLMDVMKWTPQGNLAEGKLLTIQNYDDGRCHQINGEKISTTRQNDAPNPVPDQPDTNVEMWCETDVQLPTDVPPSLLTLYWVWQWPTLPGVDPGLPDGKDEIYSSCMDIKVVGEREQVKAVGQPKPLLVQDPRDQAHPDFMTRAAKHDFPENKSFYGPDNTFVGSNPGSFAEGEGEGGDKGGSTVQSPPPPPPPASPPTQPDSPPPSKATSTTFVTVTATVCPQAARDAPAGDVAGTVTVTQTMEATVTVTATPVAETGVPNRHRHRVRRLVE